ncbi:unnamed protein product [Sphagnum jensenii]|uniref:Uncharacterized protein n=1 Tax=Sphagnum jensenii TaxID=128206 RepID=A0ABP1B440_9BRYO
MQTVRHRTTRRMMSGRRTQDNRTHGSLMNVGRTSEASLMDVERAKLSRRYYNERCSSLLWRGRQSVAARCYGEGDRALQLAAMARVTERCSLLLWRGRQSVVARYYGKGDRALQLIAMARAAAGCSSLLRQWLAAL